MASRPSPEVSASAPRLALVTGGSRGIGLATAEGLAAQGYEVVIAARDLGHARAVARELYFRHRSEVSALPLDLGNLQNVRQFAERFRGRYRRLDVLVNNAGVFHWQQRYTAEGFEAQFGVNHLGHFLLTRLLQPLLLSAPQGRVVVVSSRMHRLGQIDIDSFRGRRFYNPLAAYAQSKLANLLFAQELARRTAATRMTVNSLHPGTVATGLLRDLPLAMRWLSRQFQDSRETGARTSLILASAPELARVRGRYFVDGRPTRPAHAARDSGLAEQLWQMSERLVGL